MRNLNYDLLRFSLNNTPDYLNEHEEIMIFIGFNKSQKGYTEDVGIYI